MNCLLKPSFLFTDDSIPLTLNMISSHWSGKEYGVKYINLIEENVGEIVKRLLEKVKTIVV